MGQIKQQREDEDLVLKIRISYFTLNKPLFQMFF